MNNPTNDIANAKAALKSANTLAEFGSAIKKLREAHGLTQAELVKRANISESAMRKIEHGLTKPTMITLQSLLPHLSLTKEDLPSVVHDIFLGLLEQSRHTHLR